MKLYPNVLTLFTVWFISLSLIFYFGFSNFPHSERFKNDFFQSLSNWDGGHYLGIAQFGYSEKFQYAFFPLYPLVIKIFTVITQDYLVSSILISISSTFLSLFLLYRLMSLEFDKKIGLRVITFLLFFPTSFFLITAYSEGFFLLLTVGAFLAVKKEKFLLATILTAAASATRVMGLAVAFAIIIDILIRGGFNRKNFIVLFSPLGFLAYCLYLYTQTSDPFYFLTAQGYWQRSISVPGASFWQTIKGLSSQNFISQNFNIFLDLLFAVFGIGMAIRAFRFLPPLYSIYTFISVLLPLFTPTLSSMPRFLLPVFPIFILVALWKNELLTTFYKLLSVMLLSAFAVLFINGYWVG